MEHVLIATQTDLEPGQVISKYDLKDLGICPTNINCFEYYPYLLYKSGIKRYVLQPLPYDQYKIIKIYNFVPAKYA